MATPKVRNKTKVNIGEKFDRFSKRCIGTWEKRYRIFSWTTRTNKINILRWIKLQIRSYIFPSFCDRCRVPAKFIIVFLIELEVLKERRFQLKRYAINKSYALWKRSADFWFKLKYIYIKKRGKIKKRSILLCNYANK